MQVWALPQWSLYSNREDIHSSTYYLTSDLTALVVCATKERGTGYRELTDRDLMQTGRISIAIL